MEAERNGPEIVTPVVNAENEPVVMYLKEKCGLPETEIREKLKKGLTFDNIKGEGNDLDSRLIESVLIENDFYEKENQRLIKKEALEFVKSHVDKWSLEIAKDEKKINKDELPNYAARILAFGSHVLDLRSNSSDIDLVCVVPNFVNRENHFFVGLAGRLEQESEVKGLTRVMSSRVPIITFDYKEINIDISFCKLEEETIPRNIEIVMNMDIIEKIKDEQSVTSIMGRKNNLMILELVGSNQLENFKQTLRLIKVWSKNRGISSNAMGFLGGISWAIMLAKICQIFPYHKPSKLLSEFFNVYKLWRFKEMPIAIIEPTTIADSYDKSIPWMTVYTPGNHFNSTGRVNRITFDIMEKEIHRASEILSYNRADFQTLVQKVDFVNSFEMFMEIDVCGTAKTKEQEKEFQHFIGSVESKILNLLSNIINKNKKDLENGLKVVPNPKSYKKKELILKFRDPIYDLCNAYFIGFHLTTKADLSLAVAEWCNLLDKERAGKEHLNVRVFECTKEDFLSDVEIVEVVKKPEIEDPRLAMRARKG